MYGGHSARVSALALLAALALPLAAAELHWSNCDLTSGSYSAGSTYQDNLLQVVSALRAEIANASAAASPDLFATATAGGGRRDAAYGLVLCRGDLSFSDCQDCVISASQDVENSCANRTRDVALCYNLCYVRVSSRDFLASTNNSGELQLISGTNISSSVDVAAYSGAVTRLLNATVRYAVEKSARMFATGQLLGLDPEIPSIWSTAQCALDLSPEQCRRCLDDLVARWWQEFPTNGRGARIAGSRCNLRSELGSFYTGDAMVKLTMQGEAAAPTAAPAPSQVVAPGTAGGRKYNSAGKLLGVVLPIGVVVAIVAISLCMWSLCKKRRSRGVEDPPKTHTVEDFGSIKSTLLSLSSLQEATNNFDESNKLGEGGFGAVYKGVLSGREVAVKRLSKGSSQGLEELRNELVLVAKLHHKNLVRLEGFCLEEGERLLVYEYMTHKSLDTILFDPEEKRMLDWTKRFNIIEGVARGLQYLHEDSQKKIVHRDMKASNILLDSNMNPKIGDFGLARLFDQDQTREVTSRIVGTFGYMSPEYVMRGQFSTKLDVYSFGILVIEIVTGRRNCGQYVPEQNEDVISIVWRHWTEGTIAEMIDDSLGRTYPTDEVLKCVNIGLLCLQQNPMDRPTMSDVMVMLDGDTSSLPAPSMPIFLIEGSSAGYSYNTLSHLSTV